MGALLRIYSLNNLLHGIQTQVDDPVGQGTPNRLWIIFHKNRPERVAAVLKQLGTPAFYLFVHYRMVQKVFIEAAYILIEGKGDDPEHVTPFPT